MIKASLVTCAVLSVYNSNKNSSGDEIANVNFITTTS